MEEDASLISTTVDDHDATVRRRRPRAAALALISVSAVLGLSLAHSSMRFASRAAALRAQDWDDDDYTDENGLYVCANGVPSVPKDYADGAWGSIDGDWYVIAGNLNADTAESGVCTRMTFELVGARNATLDQSMIYTYDGTYYYWNLTGWTTDDDVTPYWKAVDDRMYDDFWSTVFAVGTHMGKRWFGWYYCGPAVDVTKRGAVFVLYESYEYDDDLLAVAEAAVRDAGLDEAGNFTTYAQSASCQYNWHHTASEDFNEWTRQRR